MKKILLPLAILIAISFGCKEEEDPILICGTTDPIADLPWLNILTNELDDSYFGVYYSVAATTYDGNDVFVIRNCCPNCNSIIPVYSCSGDKLGVLSADAGINPAILDNAKIIWKGTGYTCSN